MAENSKCVGGTRTLLEVEVIPGNTCVGIKKIVEDAETGVITITLTDGKTFSYQGRGPQGDPGVMGPSGFVLVYSDPADKSTETTNYEALSEFDTDFGNELKNLANVGDIMRLTSMYKYANDSAPVKTGIEALHVIDGVGLASITINTMSNTKASQGLVELFTDIVLVDKTTNAMQLLVINRAKVWDGNAFYVPSTEARVVPVKIGGAGTDFSTNSYNISSQAKSKDAGDIKLVIFTVEKQKRYI